MNWKIFTLLLTSLLVVTACGPTQTTDTNVDSPTGNQELKVGVIMPLTGDAAAYGNPSLEAVELAVEEINANGGVNGRMITLIAEDGSCDPKSGTAAAQKLVNVDKVKIIIGGLCSGETLSASPITEEQKVILFSPGSGSPDVTNAGDYVFRNFPSDASSGSKVALVAIQNEDTTIAIISETTDYAQAVKNVFKTTYQENGGTVLADEQFSSESNDYRTQLTKIKSSEPDAIYLIAQTPAKYGLVLKQLREMGIEQPIYTNEFAAAGDILSEYSEEIEGAIYAEPFFDETAQKSAELLQKITDKYGSVSGALPPVYLATAYDSAYILSEAMTECSEDTDCIRDYLYAVRDREGSAGILSIDENGDAEFEYVVKTIRNGQVSSLT